MAPEIEEAVKWFRKIYLDGIPVLLRQSETSFLSFVCVVAAMDALAGYRFKNLTRVGDRFSQFVLDYFPPGYSAHAAKLYLFRCRLLHNFSPAYFSLAHASPNSHLEASLIGDTTLSDETFFADMRSDSEKYFSDLQSMPQLRTNMLYRLKNLEEGGTISVLTIIPPS